MYHTPCSLYFGVNIVIVGVREVDDDAAGITSTLWTGHERGQVLPGEWASVHRAKHGTCLYLCVQVVVYVAHVLCGRRVVVLSAFRRYRVTPIL